MDYKNTQEEDTVFLSNLCVNLTFLLYILHNLGGHNNNVKLSGPSWHTFCTLKNTLLEHLRETVGQE